MSNIPCLYFHLLSYTQSTSVGVWARLLEFKVGLILVYYFQRLRSIILLLPAQEN